MKSKIVLSVIGLFMLVFCAQAQLNCEWSHSYATPDSNTYAQVIDVFDAGNGQALMATLLSTYVNQTGSSRLLLQWFSPTGVLVNQVTYTHPVYDAFRLHHGARDAAGNLYFTGHLLLNESTTGWFVISFDGAGQLRWAQETVDNGSFIQGESRSLAVSAAGDVYVGGYVTGGQSFGLLAKYNSTGTEQWTYMQPTAFAFAQDLALAPNGDVLAINESNITRLNAAGQLQWNSVDTGYYSGPDILVAADGNIYTLTYEGYIYHLRQYSAAGTLQWDYDGFAEHLAFGDYSVMLAADAQNNIYAAGINSTDTLYSTTLAKFTPQGQLTWQQDFVTPGAAFYDVLDMLLLPGGNVVVSGVTTSPNYSSGTAMLNGATGDVIGVDSLAVPGGMFNQKMVFNSGGLYVAGSGNNTYHVLKYGASLSLAAEELPAALEVFPNPFTTSVTVHADFAYEHYEVLNLAGQTVARGKPAANGVIVLDTLPAGTYLLKVQGSGKETAVRKIIKK